MKPEKTQENITFVIDENDLDKKNIHKRDKQVKLHPDYEENHIYLIKGKSHIDDGYKSVTGFIDKFFETFDADAVVDKYYDRWQDDASHKYFGRSKEDIILLWEIKGKEARDRGTNMHEVFEYYANEKEVDKELPELLSFINWYNLEVLDPFRTEYTVYGEEEKIVGNIDFIYTNKAGEMCIVDYKCSGVPNNFSYGKKCKVLGLPDTKIAKNTLQLNIYKYLLEKYYGLEIKHIYNLYIKDYNCQLVEQKVLDINPIFE